MIATLPPAWQAGELVRLDTPQKVVALTFDAGSNDAGARQLLATLRRTQTPATFFLTGRWVRLYPALARSVGKDFVVGDHTVDHADLTKLSDARVNWEIATAAREIEAATGRDPHPLFRFPYGARDSRTLRIARRLGFVPVRWTVDTLGWMGRCCQSVDRIVRRVADHLVPGEIVLLHVGAPSGGAPLDTLALPRVIAAVKARGYRFVTLSSVRARR